MDGEEQVVVQPETPVVEQPQATETVTSETSVAEQYELDGKLVDGKTVYETYKNLMPEFTRKSQELAALKQSIAPKAEEKPTNNPNPLDNPEWQPGDYKELSAAIEQKVWNQILESASAEERQAQERDAYIQREIEEVKALDKNVDVNRVMSHAAKYQFSSLLPAFQNMRAIDDAARIAEERVLKNIQARSAAPVGTPTGGGSPMSFPTDVKSGLDKARYILRNQK